MTNVHHTGRRKGFWHSLTATYFVAAFLATSLVWLYCWLYGLNPIWAVLVGLAALFGLPILELILHSPPKKKQKPRPTQIKVKMMSQDARQTYIDHFHDTSIDLNKLIELAVLVWDNDLSWLGRPTVTHKTSLSQDDYRKIANEFKYQGYLLDGSNNNYRLTFRGKNFIRAVAVLPPSPNGHSSPVVAVDDF